MKNLNMPSTSNFQVLAGVAVMIIVLAVGVQTLVLTEFGQPTEDRESPPGITLLVGDKTVSGVEGSYCWDGKCVDKLGPVDLTGDAEPTEVPRDASLRFQTEGLEPENYSYSLYDQNGSVVKRDTVNASFNLPVLEASTYVLSGSGRWDNGDVSFLYKIQVVE